MACFKLYNYTKTKYGIEKQAQLTAQHGPAEFHKEKEKEMERLSAPTMAQ